MNKNKHIQIRIDEPTKTLFEIYAKSKGWSLTELLTLATETYIQDNLKATTASCCTESED